jgi:uncharacterized Zn-binding protein involved in type VI secretion
MPAAARLGDKAQVDADAHGCPACPHPGVGPIVTGSSDVMVNGKPAARQDDLGIHAVCCGPNTFTIQRGSPTVYVNGKPFARMNDKTKHCGGTGPIIEGSPDVNVDDGANAQGLAAAAITALQIATKQAARVKAGQQAKKSDTHRASGASAAQNIAATPSPGNVRSARWSVQRAKKDQDVHLWIECTANLRGSLSVEVWALDPDGAPGRRMDTLQEQAAQSLRVKWRVAMPPGSADRVEFEYQFVVTDAQGVKLTSDTLFVERPYFRATLVDAKGAPLANFDYELTLPDGKKMTGQTDAQGLLRVDPGEQQGKCKLVLTPR